MQIYRSVRLVTKLEQCPKMAWVYDRHKGKFRSVTMRFSKWIVVTKLDGLKTIEVKSESWRRA